MFTKKLNQKISHAMLAYRIQQPRDVGPGSEYTAQKTDQKQCNIRC